MIGIRALIRRAAELLAFWFGPKVPEEEIGVGGSESESTSGRIGAAVDAEEIPQFRVEMAVSGEKTETKRRPILNPLRQKVADVAADFLDRIAGPQVNDELIKNTIFSGHRDLMGVDFHLIADLSEEMEGGARYYLLTEDHREGPDVFWPIDIATACPGDLEHVYDDGEESSAFRLTRVATVSPKELRGRVRIVPQKCIVHTCGWLTSRGFRSERRLLGLVGGRWTDIEMPIVKQRISGIRADTAQILRWTEDPSKAGQSADFHFSVRLTERYSWHVALGRDHRGPRLLLPTNPVGCLELFKTRDLLPGETRRSALRHWVNEHYRQKVNTADEVAYVREHLRGKTTFVWKGLACELMVSEFDLEKNEFFREQAAEWRAMRGHNRIRLKASA